MRATSPFLHENFLLQSSTAEQLYHTYAKDLPIIDYHSHLSPENLARNAHYPNLHAIWLKEDHGKWRAMRILGVKEKYITGAAGDAAKFMAWAKTVPYLVRNPLYHWTHMELQKPFGIDTLLNAETGPYVYEQCSALLQEDAFRPRQILEGFRVELVNTTDDPTDTLEHHRALRQNATSGTQVLPTFRPDRVFSLSGGDSFRAYVRQLGPGISSLDTLLEALEARVDFFHAAGCRMADHGLPNMPAYAPSGQLDGVFRAVLRGADGNAAAFQEEFTGYVLLHLCRMYHQHGWVQQFHIGPIRNNNSRMQAIFGKDSGFDSIGDWPQAARLAAFLDLLDKDDRLARTILYNSNPADNALFAAMAGNFTAEGIKSKVQYGPAWWFADQYHGITEQLNTLSGMGLLSCSVGMLTDSRSVLSYSRHDYFRRILCNIFGQEMDNGLLPGELPWIGQLVQDICYYNVKGYINFTQNQL